MLIILNFLQFFFDNHTVAVWSMLACHLLMTPPHLHHYPLQVTQIMLRNQEKSGKRDQRNLQPASLPLMGERNTIILAGTTSGERSSTTVVTAHTEPTIKNH